ncbi:MAG: xanthan lyase [Paludibacter sp.]|nr:xanthan lyase [Paludibacter sp.]
MKYFRQKITVAALFFLLANQLTYGQKNIENQISDSLTAIANSYSRVGKVNIIDFQLNSKNFYVFIKANERLGFIPFRAENVKRIYKAIRKILPLKYSEYKIYCQVENQNIEDLIPNFYRTENIDKGKQFAIPLLSQPLVINNSRPFQINNGLQNRHIALWQSHGWHYDQKLARWEWQRARVFQIVEDLYTQSYVLPFLVPMLENAGANVLLPRERDTQINEIIIDNDTKVGNSRYREHNDRKSWKIGIGKGFANIHKFYLQGENPFTLGTFRTNKTITDSNETSSIQWIPDIPIAGRYAVYVSYKTVENSTKDAHYTVFHKGGKTDFTINQTMSGGTWVYLGHFDFGKGKAIQNKVVLTNLSSEEDKIITADAVKFGGGMGNIARSPNEVGIGLNTKSSDSVVYSINLTKPTSVYEPEISNYPRFTEAARYWLQWAGIPDSIYSKNNGTNDYTDDFQSRGLWVNYLVGGSVVAPNLKGLGVPIDLALAFHTDAGTTPNDSIIGTLAICTIQNSDKKTTYENGVSRWASRDLTDIIQTQIVNDIRTLYAPEWTRRNLWNKSYSESRVPEVPTMLLELLSHQNFADMRYGLDPRFRFAASRSVYKGILKYLSSANGTEYIVQPLPVKQFSSRFSDKNKIELHWVSITDSLEPTANPDQYVIYTRVDNGGFDNGTVVNSNRATLTVESGKIYSFKITALNKGGESFASEILSAYRAQHERGEVLIVNGFDRLSAPASFALDSTYAGFLNDEDPGVPYLSDISFIGKQFEFKRNKPWLDDDAPGFGASHANFETKVIAGNSFDYPFLHGKTIKSAGFSFVSCSSEAVMSDDIDLNNYKVVDLILGKQKQTFIGNAKKAPEFKTFPLALQQSIRSYCKNGGNLMLSGSFIASDLYESSTSSLQDKTFLENLLKIKFRTSKASVGGNVKIVNSPYTIFKKTDLTYFDEPNSVSYYVESPDAIEPNDKDCFTIGRYTENNLSAAVAYSGSYKICAFGFPFETIQLEKDKVILMESILSFFLEK